ncbi:RNA-binding protein [Sandaracinobacteroides hominis]|uniref:RNA-binding protein n=1 Tax=Sandaracinobacteroides hominis TaxID=2780086 RepID=UPI0018F69B62|nr:RNA-binding protein [Sandaracinobacteroides hominis]
MSSNDTPDATVEPASPARATPDGGKGASAPERKCILTGAHGERAQLIRLALGPDGAVWPDLGARLPGRGAWISPDRAALETAIAKGRLKGALARAFKEAATVPDDLAQRIADGLERRALDRLGLEHRAGHLIFGSEKLIEWARAGRLYLVLHATDAADDGVGKLEQALRSGARNTESEPAEAIRLPAGRDALSRALGRENIVHSGVTDGKAAARIATEVARWAAFIGKTEHASDDRDMPGRRNDEGRE